MILLKLSILSPTLNAHTHLFASACDLHRLHCHAWKRRFPRRARSRGPDGVREEPFPSVPGSSPSNHHHHCLGGSRSVRESDPLGPRSTCPGHFRSGPLLATSPNIFAITPPPPAPDVRLHLPHDVRGLQRSVPVPAAGEGHRSGQGRPGPPSLCTLNTCEMLTPNFGL